MELMRISCLYTYLDGIDENFLLIHLFFLIVYSISKFVFLLRKVVGLPRGSQFPPQRGEETPLRGELFTHEEQRSSLYENASSLHMLPQYVQVSLYKPLVVSRATERREACKFSLKNPHAYYGWGEYNHNLSRWKAPKFVKIVRTSCLERNSNDVPKSKLNYMYCLIGFGL